jgi:hypothetical protein
LQRLWAEGGGARRGHGGPGAEAGPGASGGGGKGPVWVRWEEVMVSIGEVQSEVVVEGERSGGGGFDPTSETGREQLREVVREVLVELLERYLRVEERAG